MNGTMYDSGIRDSHHVYDPIPSLPKESRSSHLCLRIAIKAPLCRISFMDIVSLRPLDLGYLFRLWSAI